VADVVLRVRGDRAAPLVPPQMYRPFLGQRGADIELELTDEPVPRPERDSLLFSSGGVWRVHGFGDGLLYEFRSPACDPRIYKAVSIDRSRSHGRLYFPPQRGRGPRFALDHPLDELLFQHRWAQTGGLEVHACGLMVRGGAVLLCGRSGAGKSTTARLWRRARPRTLILSDDRVAVRPVRDGLRAWGTPWHGDAGCASAASGRVRAFFFLEQAGESGATPLSAPEAAARLVAAAFYPTWEAETVTRVLDTCTRIALDTPSYLLRFRKDGTAVKTVLTTLGERS
jgi:hypothetical protein